MKNNKRKQTVLNFIKAINTADIFKITDLISKDHIFIDSEESKHQGKKTMQRGWIEYFKMFPDYKIEITDITESDFIIGIFGYASGTYKGLKNEGNTNFFRVPASWKAIVKDGKIKHWQVYCETKQMEQIIERNL